MKRGEWDYLRRADTGLDLAPEFLYDCVKLGEMVRG